MRYVNEAQGTLTLELEGGQKVAAKYIDGGGMFVGGTEYEVHGEYTDGSFLCIPQHTIKRVTDSTGEEFEFGNPFMPGHPRPQVLGTTLSGA